MIKEISCLTQDAYQGIISPKGGYMAYRPKDTQERILHRLKITKGHLSKVSSMVENDVYCIDILHQLLAIQSSIKETGNLMLENHLHGCVKNAMIYGNTDASIEEIMHLFKKKI